MTWAEKLFENKSLVFAASAVAILAAAVLILLLFRMVFGRRLRAGGNGRTRLPRLGVVDAFDLDRTRQLVIIRRDNVEHLLMIGGPNDLVIESEIIRAEGREGRLREKEPREAVAAAVAWPPEPEPQRPPVRPAGPERRPQPAPAAAVEPSVPEDAAASAPPPQPTQRPVFPLPPRRPPPPYTPYAQRQPREPNPRPEQAQGSPIGAQIGSPRAPLATPFLRPPQRPAQDFGKQAAPSAAEPAPGEPVPSVSVPSVSVPSVSVPSEPAPEDAVRLAVAAEAGAAFEAPENRNAERGELSPAEAGKAASFGDMFKASAEPAADAEAAEVVDTLEEEMAKLLGRGTGKA